MGDVVAKPLPLDKMRVLVLFGAIPLHGQERGNIEVFRAMAELGMRAKFITHSKWGHLHVNPELDRHGLSRTPAKFGPLMGKNMFGFDFFRILIGILNTNWVLWRENRKWGPTHIHVMNWLYFLYASPLLFLLRKPLIYRLGDCPPRSTFLHRWLWRFICQRAACMVCNSTFVRGELEKSGGKAQNRLVIYNAPPNRAKTLLPISIRVMPKNIYFIYVGQVTAEKGVSVLIDAVRRCIDEGRNLALLIVGDYSWKNPLAAELMAQLNRDGLQEWIQFLGYQENVPALLKFADVHVCPSMWGEPLANVVLEAKAQGVPSLVFPDGGLPEMIEHKVDGFICSDKTVEALCEGIRWFLDHPEDRKRAGAAALRSLNEKFGAERFQREWAEVFLSTAKSHGEAHCQASD